MRDYTFYPDPEASAADIDAYLDRPNFRIVVGDIFSAANQRRPVVVCLRDDMAPDVIRAPAPGRWKNGRRVRKNANAPVVNLSQL